MHTLHQKPFWIYSFCAMRSKYTRFCIIIAIRTIYKNGFTTYHYDKYTFKNNAQAGFMYGTIVKITSRCIFTCCTHKSNNTPIIRNSRNIIINIESWKIRLKRGTTSIIFINFFFVCILYIFFLLFYTKRYPAANVKLQSSTGTWLQTCCACVSKTHMYNMKYTSACRNVLKRKHICKLIRCNIIIRRYIWRVCYT